jgi:hypothetical protein
MKTIACVVAIGLALGACTYRSETVVQKPQPSATATTYVTPDSSSPTGTSSTTVVRTN